MSTLLYTFLSFLTLTASSHAGSCLKANKGDTCAVTIVNLRPTQFNLGQLEINERSAKFANMSDKKLQAYIKANPAPVVLGPQSRIYVLDHHHLARSLSVAGVEEMNAVIVDDLSALDMQKFWLQMISSNRLFLEDRGVGPLAPEQLPLTLAEMPDDPYRSLAWAVRKNNGYEDSTVLYADFLWANFFRSRIDLSNGIENAVDGATRLAHSSAAKGLPGYIP
ncbi:MAG: ParB-like protein [Bdellovibrionales bacterium]